MTVTSWPAWTSARLSCQTRRSNGTLRFSTRIRMRAIAPLSPGRAEVAARMAGQLGPPHQVDQKRVLRARGGLDRVGFGARQDDDLGTEDGRHRRGDHEAREVRDAGIDIGAVRAREVRDAHVRIMDAEVEAPPEQTLRELHHRALT